MTQFLHVHLGSGEGALLRALGTIERRGYKVLACHTSHRPRGGMQLEVQLGGGRSDVDLLCRQLMRLYDVTHAAPIHAVD